MQIIFNPIHNACDIPMNITDLYLTSFCEPERRDWDDIVRRIDSGDPIFRLYVLQHNSENIGFITLWRLPGTLYCEHFAIFRYLRDKGYGTAVIEEAIAMAGHNPLALEVELPETSDEAAHRIRFYEKCGMTAMQDFPYWQPPYRKDLPEVPMMLMVSKPLADPTAFVMMLHTVVYNQ